MWALQGSWGLESLVLLSDYDYWAHAKQVVADPQYCNLVLAHEVGQEDSEDPMAVEHGSRGASHHPLHRASTVTSRQLIHLCHRWLLAQRHEESRWECHAASHARQEGRQTLGDQGPLQR